MVGPPPPGVPGDLIDALLGERHVYVLAPRVGGIRGRGADLARVRRVVAVALRRRKLVGSGLLFGAGLVLVDEGEPVARRFALARGYLEEGFLYAFGDGAAASLADGYAVDAPDGSDLGGRAREEKLVGD